MTTPSACESLGQGARIDRYVVDSVLRRDRNSITYKCNDERSGTVSLVELCPANLVTRNALGQLVARDAGASGKFESLRDHFEKVGLKLHKVQRPNLARVLDVISANNSCYLVKVVEDSVSLGEILKHAPALGYDDVKKLLFPLLDALRTLHENGVLHLGLAPDSIMIRSDGSPVLDGNESVFGSHAGNGKSKPDNATDYRPIEQITDGQNVGPWSDIYSFSAVIYRCICGEPPPSAAERQDAVSKTGADIYRRARILSPEGLADSMLEAVDHALRLNPAERPKSVREWTQEFLHLSPDGDVTVVRDAGDLKPRPEAQGAIAEQERSIWEIEDRNKLFRALISGKGQSFYMGPIVRQDERGLIPKVCWNSAAFLFHVFWLCYRKMYAFAIILWPAVATVTFVAAHSILGANSLSDRYWAINPAIDQAFLVTLLVLSVLFGMFGNYLYYLHLRFKIARVRRRFPDVKSQRGRCSEIGGVSEFALVVPALFLASSGYYTYNFLRLRDQTAREQVGEAMAALNAGTSIVSEYFRKHGIWPEGSKDVFAPTQTYSYKYVGEISAVRQLVVVTFKGYGVLPELAGRSVAVFGQESGGRIGWICGSIDAPLEYLPPGCKTRLK